MARTFPSPAADPRPPRSIGDVFIHPTYARMLGMLLRSLNVDVDAVLAGVGLSWAELSVADQMLSFDTMRRLSMEAVRVSQRPWLGLELGQALQPSVHGPVGYAIVASRDLRQAFETLSLYGDLRIEALRYELQRVPGGAVLHVREKIDLADLRDVALDVAFAALLKLVESVVPVGLERVVIALPRAQPAWAERYRRVFPGKLRFNAPHMSITLDDALLDTPSLTADAADFDAACRECTRAQSHALAAAAASICMQVQALLNSRPDHYPQLDEVAAQLQTSPRTLMRKLKSEGSSYQSLLDEHRKARALWYLQHTRMSVEEIAAQLGYADTSNFSRTFRRWFGTTAVEMRGRLARG